MPSLSFGTFFEGTLTRQEHACLTSFVRLGHRVDLFSYAPLRLPPGVHARDAAEILPRNAFYQDNTGGLHQGTASQFTNHFRYAMIARTGLAWIDTDVICLSPNWPDTDWLLAKQDMFLVNGAILRVPRDHPFLTRAMEVAERLKGITVWGLIGPHLLTALANEFSLWAKLMPVDAFYPLHYARAAELLRPLRTNETFRIPTNALCIHLWNEVLRTSGYDKAVGPVAGSALAILLDRAERGLALAGTTIDP